MLSLMMTTILPFSCLFFCVTLFPFLTHPMAMSATLLAVAVLIAVLLGTVTVSYWLSYCLALILLGGLFVIFVYITLLASDEKFSLPAFPLIFCSLLTVSATGILLSSAEDPGDEDPFLSEWNGGEVYSEDLFIPLYSDELSNLTIFIVFYLFLTLLVVVFNTKSSSMTLRSQKT